MTLRELMNLVDEAAWREQVPTIVQLLQSKSPVAAAEKMGEEIEITAFQNGYVLYQNGDRATVFPLHDCRKEYVEKDQTDTEHKLSFEVFAEQPWQTRAFMEGERRLVHNSNNRRRYFNEISYDGFMEGGSILSDEGLSDPLTLLLEAETRDEELAKLHDCLETLTEKQRFILIECVVNGRMQIDVANEMGTTRMNVSISLQRTLDKLRTSFGVGDRKFMRNTFYRPKK